MKKEMLHRMGMVLIALCLLAVAREVLPERDGELVGNWRGVKPAGPDDQGEVFEFRFDKKGKAAIFRVLYDWDADSQSWSPATADQPAQGDNDEWTTENGFFTIEVRESYMTNRNLVCRYRISGDTLRLQMAEIFRPAEGQHEGIFGKWRMETYDQSYPEEKRVREIEIVEPGILKETVGGKEYQGRIYPEEGGWKQLAQLRAGAENEAADTLYQPYTLAEGNLYLYQNQTWQCLVRRK